MIQPTKPILFSDSMVRAILDGRKTETRRIVKIQSGPTEYPGAGGAQCVQISGKNYWWNSQKSHPEHVLNACPYGQPGTRLWVREAWRPVVDKQLLDCIEYRADGARIKPDVPDDNTGFRFSSECDSDQGRWRPSIHLPRWASRLELEVQEVRVERLHEITDQGAIAEGVELEAYPVRSSPTDDYLWRDYLNPGLSEPSARRSYQSLWASIHGEESWEKNPWVWVVVFAHLKS